MADSEGKTVLVVDDDEDLSELVATVLAEEGYAVEIASDGVAALDAIARSMPDLILLDMKMPVMDGAEFARLFEKRFNHQAPIVILTASAGGRQRADEVGAVDWVAKPFDLTALVDAVSRNINPPA